MDVLTVREAVTRAKADGLPISEYTLRSWIRSGAFPVRKIGQKALVYYPSLVEFVQHPESQLQKQEVAKIRRLEA